MSKGSSDRSTRVFEDERGVAVGSGGGAVGTPCRPHLVAVLSHSDGVLQIREGIDPRGTGGARGVHEEDLLHGRGGGMEEDRSRERHQLEGKP